MLAVGALSSVIGSGSNVFAAQNHEGVCQIETKTGEFSFNASGKEITTTKLMDLLVIIDGSAYISEAARGLHPWNTGGGESLEN